MTFYWGSRVTSFKFPFLWSFGEHFSLQLWQGGLLPELRINERGPHLGLDIFIYLHLP